MTQKTKQTYFNQTRKRFIRYTNILLKTILCFTCRLGYDQFGSIAGSQFLPNLFLFISGIAQNLGTFLLKSIQKTTDIFQLFVQFIY